MCRRGARVVIATVLANPLMMDPMAPLLILLVILVLIVVPIIAIIAFVRTLSVQKSVNQIPQLTSRVYDLEQRVKSVDRKVGALAANGAEDAPSSSRVVASGFGNSDAPSFRETSGADSGAARATAGAQAACSGRACRTTRSAIAGSYRPRRRMRR